MGGKTLWARPGLVGIQQTYKFYTNRHKEPKLVYDDYIAINTLFFNYLMGRIINGERIKLPEKMGTMVIEGSRRELKVDENGKVMNKAIDWDTTKKVWARNSMAREEKRLIYHLNEHTHAIMYSLKWFKSNILSEGKHLYSFTATRAIKRRIAKGIKEGKEYTVYNRIIDSYGKRN